MTNTTAAPSLADLLRTAASSALYGARVSIPARVEAVYPNEQTIDAKPLIRDLVPDEGGGRVPQSVPVVSRCPIQFLRWGGFVLRALPKIGDLVMLHFADRGLGTWLSGNGVEADAEGARAHALTDAFATPGVPTLSTAIEGLSDGALVIGRENGDGEVRIEADGSIRIGAATGDAPASARVGDATLVDATTDPAFINVLTALHAFMSAMSAVPPGAGGPFNVPASAFLASVGSAVSSVTGKVHAGSGKVRVG